MSDTKNEYVTQHDIINGICEATKVTKHDAYEVYNGLIAGICANLAEGKDVKLTRFCTFECVDRPEHPSRNPRTGEPVMVAAKTVVKVRNKKLLHEAGIAATQNA